MLSRYNEAGLNTYAGLGHDQFLLTWKNVTQKCHIWVSPKSFFKMIARERSLHDTYTNTYSIFHVISKHKGLSIVIKEPTQPQPCDQSAVSRNSISILARVSSYAMPYKMIARKRWVVFTWRLYKYLLHFLCHIHRALSPLNLISVTSFMLDLARSLLRWCFTCLQLERLTRYAVVMPWWGEDCGIQNRGRQTVKFWNKKNNFRF